MNAFAVSTAFATYFSMYAFRKPFAAATFDQPPIELFGFAFAEKNTLIVAQLLGYAISKYLGIWVNSEVTRRRRFATLVGLIVVAELALLAFGAAPAGWRLARVAALFANGLPLGMIWGLVVQYLEGRRMSEVLLTGLSCSYILASGFVKDIGRALLAGGLIPVLGLSSPFPPLSDYWMPAAVGGLFFPLLLASAWLLDHVPAPTAEDEAARVRREPMPAAKRAEFLRRYGVALVAALAAFFLLTALRDYRDTYLIEVLDQLGYDYQTNRSIVSQAEILVAFGVAAILSQLHRFRDNRWGLAATYGVMACGLLLAGAATLLLDTGRLSGFWWIVLVGLGAYTAFIPFGAVLFDRAIAATGAAGTAVFGAYLADAVGYTGSVAFYLASDTLLAGLPHLELLRGMAYVNAVVGTALLAVSCAAFLRAPRSGVTRGGSGAD